MTDLEIKYDRSELEDKKYNELVQIVKKLGFKGRRMKTDKLISFILEYQEKRHEKDENGDAITDTSLVSPSEANDNSVHYETTLADLSDLSSDSFTASHVAAEANMIAAATHVKSSGDDSILNVDNILEDNDPFDSCKNDSLLKTPQPLSERKDKKSSKGGTTPRLRRSSTFVANGESGRTPKTLPKNTAVKRSASPDSTDAENANKRLKVTNIRVPKDLIVQSPSVQPSPYISKFQAQHMITQRTRGGKPVLAKSYSENTSSTRTPDRKILTPKRYSKLPAKQEGSKSVGKGTRVSLSSQGRKGDTRKSLSNLDSKASPNTKNISKTIKSPMLKKSLVSKLKSPKQSSLQQEQTKTPKRRSSFTGVEQLNQIEKSKKVSRVSESKSAAESNLSKTPTKKLNLITAKTCTPVKKSPKSKLVAPSKIRSPAVKITKTAKESISEAADDGNNSKVSTPKNQILKNEKLLETVTDDKGDVPDSPLPATVLSIKKSAQGRRLSSAKRESTSQGPKRVIPTYAKPVFTIGKTEKKQTINTKQGAGSKTSIPRFMLYAQKINKMPNFKRIHQKAFDNMEDVSEVVAKKKLASEASAKKQPPPFTPNVVSTKAMRLDFGGKSASKLGTTPIKFGSDTPKTGVKFVATPASKHLSRLSSAVANSGGRKASVSAAFAHSVKENIKPSTPGKQQPSNALQSKLPVKKKSPAVVNRSKISVKNPIVTTHETRRAYTQEYIKGVRTNKRFQLQMERRKLQS